MRITINQREITLRNEDTLFQAIHSIGLLEAGGIAVAVNNIVIPKSKWECFSLKEHDKVIVVHATQGG